MKPRPCPGCRQQRHPTQFVADSPYCQGCRDLGPQYPVGEGEAVTAKGNRRDCPWCHEPKANLSEHKKACKARPAGAELPKKRGGRPPNPKGPLRRAPSPEAPTDGCQVCGLNVAERDLAAQGIRAGLSFDNAVGFVRQARGVFGR